jgi:integrase/recombinase XerD
VEAMSSHKSTKRGGATKVAPAPDYPSLVRYAELLKLRGLSASTQEEYPRYLRKLAARAGRDPADLDEAAVRGHILYLKDEHHYAPSSMRTAVAALHNFYRHLLGHEWRLFELVSAPSPRKLPTVLTRAEVARLWTVLRKDRFRVILRLIYATGLRIGEAVNLEVRDLRGGEPGFPRIHVRAGKGGKDRLVPIPDVMLGWLRAWWLTHRHPRWLFPGVGRGWRDGAVGASPARLAAAEEPMGVGSIQHGMRLAVAEAHLPAGTCVHTLRHSYATHLLEEGVSIRLISAYLGHSSLETTLVYTHLTAVNEAGARAAVARLLAPPAPAPKITPSAPPVAPPPAPPVPAPKP